MVTNLLAAVGLCCVIGGSLAMVWLVVKKYNEINELIREVENIDAHKVDDIKYNIDYRSFRKCLEDLDKRIDDLSVNIIVLEEEKECTTQTKSAS